MILILGGTTEGRKAVTTLDKAGKTFFYSTRSDLQQVEAKYAARITGAMDADELAEFYTSNSIRLIVDAAHPFASQLHIHVKNNPLPVCRKLPQVVPPRQPSAPAYR